MQLWEIYNSLCCKLSFGVLKSFFDCFSLLIINVTKWEANERRGSAINIFNTAFEFTSIGKFDSALLLLFSILESLFFKFGEYNKKDILIERLLLFFQNNEWKTDIKTLITDVTKYRNEFIHQGIGLERFKTYRSLNDREGHLQGQKPFVHDAWYPMPEKEFKDYNNLMRLVIHILLSEPNVLFSFYCQHIQI